MKVSSWLKTKFILLFYAISVIYGDASVDHTAPQFTLEPKDTIIPEGKPTTLQCRATGKPSPTYSWKRNGIDIVIAPGARERLLGNGDLYISKVDASMVGRYQCVVKVIYSAVSLTILSRTANLKMSVTPLTFKSNPQPVTGYIGGAVRLSVDVSDFVPAPQVAWLNRGGSMVSDAKYTALPQGVIQINDLSEANKGEIQAVAQNPIDKTQIRSQFAKITIEPANKRPASSALAFLGTPKPVTLRWGRSTILECLADAPGAVTYTWLKNNSPLSLTGRYSIYGKGNLKVRNVREEDDATFTCKAQSGGAEIKASTRITVQIPPQFTLIPYSPTYGIVDGDATFRYKVIGTPKPTISWMRDGISLAADMSYLIQRDGFLKATGLIKGDSGMYQVFARNEAGESQASAELIIRSAEIVTAAPTTLIPTSRPRSSFSPGKPQNVNAYAKSASEMFVSWQPPDVTNGQITKYNVIYFPTSVLMKSGKVSVNGQTTYVTISNLDPDTEYKFRVQAVNEKGNGPLSAAATATTTSSSSVPSVINTLSRGSIMSNSISLSWAVPSGAPVTKYIVYYTDYQNTPSTTLQKETTTNTIYIDGLKSSTNYRFSVVPFNGNIQGPRSATFDWKTLQGSSGARGIQNFKVSPISPSISTLTWMIPVGTTPPTGYKIYYVDMDRSPNTPNTIDATATTTAFVRNLKPSTTYKFWVVPYWQGSQGTKSNEITIKTAVAVPSISPQNVKIATATTNSLTINWDALTKDQSNGPLSAYILKYKIPGSKLPTSSLIVLPAVTSTVISGLKSNTEYNVKIAGRNSAGDGPFSKSVRGKTTQDSGPSKPINFEVNLDPTNPQLLNLVWDASSSFSSKILQYEIEYKTGGQWERYQVGGTSRNLRITNGLTSTNYDFKIRARDSNSWGDFSDVVSVRTMNDVVAPGPVRNLASTSTSSDMTITWQPPLNYRTVYVSGYKIIIRDLTDPTNVFDVVNLKLWNNNRHVVRKGIVAGNEYDITVQAVNAKGGESTIKRTTTTISKASPVIVITDVKTDQRSIAFNWSDTISSFGGEYIIKYTKYDAESRPIPISLTTKSQYIKIDGLTPYTKYSFDVHRRGAFVGSGAKVEKTTLAAVPSAPVDVTARSNNTWVLLNWQVPIYPNGEIETYKILYTTDNSQKIADRIVQDVGGNVMTYNLTGLTSDTMYYFQVLAVNNAGAGAISESLAIATGTGAATGVLVPGGGAGGAGAGAAGPAAGAISSEDDLDSKLWWIVLIIILLLLLLILLLLLLYCCCCRKKGRDCCPCCFACFDKYCLPCLVFCFPCCCKGRKKKLMNGNNAYVPAPGTTLNGFGGKSEGQKALWKGGGGSAAAMVEEEELKPLRANEFEAAVPPPTPISPVSGRLNAEGYSRAAASNGSLNSSRSGGGIRVAVPGDTTFISYKTSLNDYCQKSGWQKPSFNTNQEEAGFTSAVVCGGSQFSSGGADLSASKQAAEQRAAFAALQSLGVIPMSAKFGVDASISVPSPGEQSFISYKCSLHDFCQQCNILPPRFTTSNKSQGYTSQVSVGSHTFNTDTVANSSQDSEQKAAYTALHGLSMMESGAQYNPPACFTVSGPGDTSFISFKSSLHDFCQRYKLPPPQYITTQMAQGYSAKLKFGGLFFQSSDYFTTRLEAEQHAAFEALQGLGLLESGVRFGSGDTERASSRAGSQLSLSSSGVGEVRTMGSRSHSRHGSASQLSYGSSSQHTMESSALYRSDSAAQAQSDASNADGRTVFISKTSIPRVERSNSYGTAERGYEKSSESRFGNGVSYSVTYQHSTVRNVSTLPRKQPATYGTSSTSYSQYTNTSNRLGNNRRAYSSSSSAVNKEENLHDFPESKSASHPALTDLEREMAGLEGLIKDLNGITTSTQGVQK